ncbi:MAG: oligosaccharide flippase family protein [Chloroflexota bacterium]
MGGLTMVLRPLNLIATVILARLLDPADFGLVALAMILFSTSHLFVGLGMGPAIIHSEYKPSQVAFPAFLITTITGFTTYFLVIWNTEFIAQLLGSMNVTAVLQALSLLLILNAFSIVPLGLLRKEMMFPHVAASIMAQQIVYLVASVCLAWGGYGLWSLVYGRLLAQLTSTVWVWFAYPGWDWLIPNRFDIAIFHSLLTYGIKTFAGGITSYLHSHWDDWLVGRMLGEVALGFYSKAYQFSNETLGKLARSTVGTVFFSTYVKLRDDEVALRNTYLKSIQMVLVLMVPISCGLIVIAPQLVSIVFGPKWVFMTTTLQIYALVVLSRPISENSAPFFQALGHPEYNMRAGIALLFVMIPLALLLLPWNIEGVALAVTISHFFGAIYNIYQAEKLLPGLMRPTLISCGQSYLNGLIMASGIYIFIMTILEPAGWGESLLGLLSATAIGIPFYLVGLYVIQKDLFFQIIGLVTEQLKRLQRFMPARFVRHIEVERVLK